MEARSRINIKPFENNSWSRAPISPSDHQGPPISPLLESLICPLRHQRAQLVPCAIKGPISRFPIRSFSLPPHSNFPIASFMVSNFPIGSSKGPKFSIEPLRALNFLVIKMTSNFPSAITLSRGPNLSLGHQGAPIMISIFQIRYQGVPICKKAPFPPSRRQRDPNFQNTPCI